MDPEQQTGAKPQMKVKVNIDNRGFTSKPSKHAASISNRTRQAPGQKELEPEELINFIKRGYTFTPGVIGGSSEEHKARQARKDSNLEPYWKSMQIIAVDVDNDHKESGQSIINKFQLTPAAALDVCKAAGIVPMCIYKTFSYTPEHEKFRVLILLKDALTNFEKAHDYIDRCNNMFNRAIAETYKAQGLPPEFCTDGTIEPVKLIFGGRPDCVIYQPDIITPTANRIIEALPRTATNGPISASNKKAQNNAPKSNKANTGHAGAENTRDLLVSALYAINPSNLAYEKWRDIGAALKYEGIDYSIFDNWSAQDTGTNKNGEPRYNEQANYKIWQGWSNPGQSRGNKTLTAGTVFYIALKNGWNFPKQENQYFTPEAYEEIEKEWSAADFPPEFFEEPNEAPGENINMDDINNLKSIEENMPQGNAKQEPKPAPMINAADYLTIGYDSDIEDIQKYQGRKMGLHEDIDKYLTLYPGLAVLGGQASLGKTTFCVNIAARLLERGEHVLYFALEQRPDEIITKIITRYICENYPDANITNIMLNNGLRNAQVTGSINALKDKLKNMFVIECDFETTAAGIIAQVEQYIKQYNIKPVVIIDYLQLVAPPVDFRGDIRACIDDNLKAFKRMQKNNGLFVLAVSSFNRSSNYEPISYESFKETGMIESTCDYVFGLQLTIQDSDNTNFYLTEGAKGMKERPKHQKINMIQEEQNKFPKHVEFVSLKNRKGKQFFTACFNYYPCYDFYDVDNIGLDAYIAHRTPKANNKALR